MTSLTTLGSSPFDGQDPAAEVDGFPTQGEKLTTPESGVHGNKYCRRQVVAKVGEGRQQFSLTLVSPTVGGLASLTHRGITCIERCSEPSLFLLIQEPHLGSAINPRLVY